MQDEEGGSGCEGSFPNDVNGAPRHGLLVGMVGPWCLSEEAVGGRMLS